jgi:hypothetical protein
MGEFEGGGPDCPVCARPLQAIGADDLLHWLCLTCGTLRPTDGLRDGRAQVRAGDLVARRIEAGRWDVGIGGIAHLGVVYRGVGAWVATRRPDRFDRKGTLYESRGMPEVLGVANSIEDAIAFYAPAREEA